MDKVKIATSHLTILSLEKDVMLSILKSNSGPWSKMWKRKWQELQCVFLLHFSTNNWCGCSQRILSQSVNGWSLRFGMSIWIIMTLQETRLHTNGSMSEKTCTRNNVTRIGFTALSGNEKHEESQISNKSLMGRSGLLQAYLQHPFNMKQRQTQNS